MSAQHGFDLAPGDVLSGRYRLDELLGEGGFGAVYRATQLNLDRKVAIKVVLPHLLATPELLQRFLREAQVAQRLEHPNTVRMYDFGHTDSGIPYIAWELLKGLPLDEALKQGPLPVGRVVRITTQVLKALMEAHSQGIVHRDIKPANIFLSDFQGEPDFVKVLDFGIAKALDTTEANENKNLTLAGQIIGTPNYMAPEQVEGREVGPTADLYSLGLLMAEMLTGEAVLQGSGLAVCAAHLSPEPLPIKPQVQQSPLGPVILRATQKAVAARYMTAQHMLEDLRAVASEGGLDTGLLQGGFTGSGLGSSPGFGSPPSSGAAWDARTPPSMLTPQPTVGPALPTSGGGGQSRLLLILVGVLGTLVIVGGLIIGVMAFVIADDPEPSGGPPQVTTTNPQVSGPQTPQTPGYQYPQASQGPQIPQGLVGPSIQGNLALLTSDLIVQRVQAAGYSLTQQPINQNAGVARTTVVTGMSGQSIIAVSLYDYDIPMAVPALVNGLRQQPGVVHNDDHRVLYVRCMGNATPGLDQQMLSYMLR